MRKRPELDVDFIQSRQMTKSEEKELSIFIAESKRKSALRKKNKRELAK